MFWSNKPKFYTGLNPKDLQALEEVADALRERLQGLDARIDALEAEVESLKRKPHQSLKSRLKEKTK